MSDEWSILSKVLSLLREANYIGTSDTEPVVNFFHPNELKQLMDFDLQDDRSHTSEEIEIIIKDVLKYSVKTGHHHFHNQLFAGVDPYGLAGSWITEAVNTSQYTYEVGPVFTLIETAVIRKCLDIFGFANGDGIFCPGGSMSNMYAMVAARYKAIPNVKSAGTCGHAPLVAFTSDDAHYSIKKAVHWLGIGTNNLVSIKTDDKGRMIADELEEAIKLVLASGKKPFFVNATAGTTVLGAFDEFHKIADICHRYKIWMHVDACLGGTALLSSKRRHLLEGMNRADSVSWNPHKTLGAPLQCSIFLAQEKGLLHECNSANANYLFQQDKFYDVSYDTGDKSVQCGRKVDALKIWLMFKARGMGGFDRIVDNAFDCANYFTQEIRKRDGFRLVIKEFQYTNVCFWYIPKKMRGLKESDMWWSQIYKIVADSKEKMVKSGRLLIGYSPLTHKNIGNFFRMVVTCHPPPTKASMDFVIEEIERVGESL